MNRLLKKSSSILMVMAMVSLVSCSANTSSSKVVDVSATDGIKITTAITEVFGEGQKITAVAIAYDKDIDNSKISEGTYSVDGRTITKVYTNTKAEKTSNGTNGKYVIIELSETDKNALTTVLHGSGPSGRYTRGDGEVAVTQVQDVSATDGSKYTADTKTLVSSKAINLIADDFKQFEFKDSKTGKSLKYNLYVPQNYDKTKSYPMVLFMHDASVTGDQTIATLSQGNGATVWASPSEQAKHPAFVLAPQYSEDLGQANDESVDITVDLINYLTSQYSIDTNRLYTTGQSGGCMRSIAIDIKYPDLFAASYLVAGQWDASLVGPMANDKLWIIVSEGDIQAYPGMNAITAELEKDGAKVSRATWSGKSTAEEFSSNVSKMEADGNNINYTVLQKGTVVPEGEEDNPATNHMDTWKIAYNIEGIRDWLFAQSK